MVQNKPLANSQRLRADSMKKGGLSMKNELILTGFVLVTLCMAQGCLYTPQTSGGDIILPDRIKTIAVPTLDNKTAYYGINEDLTKAVIEEFIRNGRLTVTDIKDANAVLKGEIVKYLLVPVSYDENDVVEQKKLKIIVNLEFRDSSTDEILWEEKWTESPAGTEIGGIVEEVRFFVTDKGGTEIVETEEDARKRIVERLAEDIVRRTIYGW